MAKSKREKPIQSDIHLAVGGRKDTRLFRNNCGLAVYPDGSRVKYGIANPGGSDLIGWQSVLVTPQMVGRLVAIFLAIETKAPDKNADGNQQHFINCVISSGGKAGVARSVQDAFKIIDD